MKKQMTIILSMCAALDYPLCMAERTGVDKIIARVNGVNILQCDLTKPSILRDSYTLDDLISEELLFQRAAEKHLIPSTQDVDRRIVELRSKQEFNDKEFEQELLNHHGLTFKEYKAQFSRALAIQNVQQAELSEKIMVTSQEVESYFNAHPEEKYRLSLAVVSDSDVKDGNLVNPGQELIWSDLDWVNKQDLGGNFAIVTTMSVGQISKPLKTDEGYELVKVTDYKKKTLDECYGSIERILQDKRRQESLPLIEQELRKNASIVYLE